MRNHFIRVLVADRSRVLASCRALASALLDGLLDALESPGSEGAATAVLPFFLVRILWVLGLSQGLCILFIYHWK